MPGDRHLRLRLLGGVAVARSLAVDLSKFEPFFLFKLSRSNFHVESFKAWHQPISTTQVLFLTQVVHTITG